MTDRRACNVLVRVARIAYFSGTQGFWSHRSFRLAATLDLAAASGLPAVLTLLQELLRIYISPFTGSNRGGETALVFALCSATPHDLTVLASMLVLRGTHLRSRRSLRYWTVSPRHRGRRMHPCECQFWTGKMTSFRSFHKHHWLVECL